MAMIIGIVSLLTLGLLAVTVLKFVFRFVRHAVQDVSQYARHQNPTVSQSRAQHRSIRTGKPQFTQTERDYLSAHVPDSARSRKR